MGNNLCNYSYINDNNVPKSSKEPIINFSENIASNTNKNNIFSQERASNEFNRNFTNGTNNSNNAQNEVHYRNASYLPILSQYNRKNNNYITNYYSTLKEQDLNNILNSKISKKEKIKHLYALNTITYIQSRVRKFLSKKREKLGKNDDGLNYKTIENTLSNTIESKEDKNVTLKKYNIKKANEKVKKVGFGIKNFNTSPITLPSPSPHFYFLQNSEGDNRPSGFNVKVLSCGKSVRSFFSRGETNGFTLVKAEDYNEFYGESFGDKANGYGVFSCPYKGCVYEGEFRENVQSGVGEERWYNGEVFKGEYFLGRKNGLGYYSWPDGSLAYGTWVNNHLHGIGIYNHKNEWSYKGNFIMNVIEGYGELKNNRKKFFYFGFFKNNKRNGFGVQIETFKEDKTIFVGFWENNKIKGYGKIMHNTGKEIFGFFNNNNLAQRLEPNVLLSKLKSVYDKKYINMFLKSYGEYNETIRQMTE